MFLSYVRPKRRHPSRANVLVGRPHAALPGATPAPLRPRQGGPYFELLSASGSGGPVGVAGAGALPTGTAPPPPPAVLSGGWRLSSRAAVKREFMKDLKVRALTLWEA